MTNEQYQLNAQKRILLGKKAKRVRAEGLIPANIFGKVASSIAISVNHKEFSKMYADAGETGVVYLQVEGEKSKRPTLIDSVEYDPMTGKALHVSFRQVDLKQKVTAVVPVELIGELAVQEASVNQMVQEIEVEALPTDFPEAFTIDLTQFTEIGQEFTVKQLSYDASKLTLSIEPDEVLLQVQELQQMAEEEVPTPETVIEGQEGTEAPVAEGEATPTAEAPTEEKKE